MYRCQWTLHRGARVLDVLGRSKPAPALGEGGASKTPGGRKNRVEGLRGLHRLLDLYCYLAELRAAV